MRVLEGETLFAEGWFGAPAPPAAAGFGAVSSRTAARCSADHLQVCSACSKTARSIVGNGCDLQELQARVLELEQSLAHHRADMERVRAGTKFHTLLNLPTLQVMSASHQAEDSASTLAQELQAQMEQKGRLITEKSQVSPLPFHDLLSINSCLTASS
jgi:hypothetical protein